MRKRQSGQISRERLIRIGRALTLTTQEMAMVVVIFLSMLIGAVAMHYRNQYRLAHPQPAAPAQHEAASPAD
jgi:Na+-transporting methylmalonyl-CoA/oxaloacetate decarboxylase gamma subunit